MLFLNTCWTCVDLKSSKLKLFFLTLAFSNLVPSTRNTILHHLCMKTLPIHLLMSTSLPAFHNVFILIPTLNVILFMGESPLGEITKMNFSGTISHRVVCIDGQRSLVGYIVHRLAKSRTRLRWLSAHPCMHALCCDCLFFMCLILKVKID